jgi:hypothetical protein
MGGIVVKHPDHEQGAPRLPIELTVQQQQAVDTTPEPRLIDPRTQKAYVLVQADVYERLRGFRAEDTDLDMRQVAALVERAMREDDAGDPTLEFYQRKYGRKP